MTMFKHVIAIATLANFLVGCGTGGEHSIVELDPITAKVGIAKGTSEMQVVKASGRIEAVSSANVSTRMMGSVAKVFVKPGDQVKKGDLLVEISSADLRAKSAQVEAAIVQAKSGLENAENDYSRFKILHEKGSASQKELEDMSTRYEVAMANLEAAQQMQREVEAQFAYTNLRAPFSGVVTNTFVKEGDLANPGMPLVAVEGTTAYEAVVMVPESQIEKVMTNARATVLVKSKNLAMVGKVKEVSPSATNTGGQFLVKIALDDTEGVIPGMFVNADIVIDQKSTSSASPFVAQDALVRGGQLTGIYTLGHDNTAILRWVKTGREIGNSVEILSGISEGEKYLFKPEGKLFNGAKVSIN